jgi:hypothetical protein
MCHVFGTIVLCAWIFVTHIVGYIRSACCATASVLYRLDIKTIEFIPKSLHPCTSEHSRSVLLYGSISPHVLYSSTVQQVSSTDFMLQTLQYVTYFYAFSPQSSYIFIGIQCPRQKQTGHCVIYKRKTPANFQRDQFAGANKVIPLFGRDL